jgi:hypothetical protein
MNLQEQITEKILTLQTQLLSQHPLMPTLLAEIHSTLRDNPDCVTLLTEEEIGVIVNGLSKQTATEIATTALKSKSKSLKQLSLDDL